MTAKHQLEKFSDGFGILPDLLLCPRVQYGETSVDMPSIGVDSQHNVALDVFDAANITIDLPGELAVRKPGGTHAQECSVCYSLRVCRDAVMFLGCEADVIGVKTRKDFLDSIEALLGCTLPNQNKGLTFGIDFRSM